MAVSKKQLEANKRNAKKGGVKTSEGKAVIKYNAIKHGLLVKEIVITVGEGAENPEEFQELLGYLINDLKPVGSVEEMLVEKIASAYWRLRRAYKYEVGLVRSELDCASDDFYDKENWDGRKIFRTDKEIDVEIQRKNDMIKDWKEDLKKIDRLNKENKSLKRTYILEDAWEFLYDDVFHNFDDSVIEMEDLSPETMAENLKDCLGWSERTIWKKLKNICEKRIIFHNEKKAELEREKRRNVLRIQVKKNLGNIPQRHELDRLLRYETTIEREFYKALNQLERFQRMRSGDTVPAPLEGNLNLNINN
jgi:hypothetical protein